MGYLGCSLRTHYFPGRCFSLRISVMLLFIYFHVLTIAVPIVLSADNLEKLTDLSEINPPADVHMEEIELGELSISWNSNLSEDIHKMFSINYQFEWKYNDSVTWQPASRMEDPEYTDDFELHRGVDMQVKNVIIEKPINFDSMEAESNWTEMHYPPASGDPETAAANISCIVYNNTYMNCSWQIGTKAPEDIVYFLHYRQDDDTRICTDYLKDDRGRHIGCHIVNGIDTEVIVILLVNGSSQQAEIYPIYRIFQPSSFEKFNPPVNVQVVNHTVKWDISDNTSITNPRCFAYLLNVKDWTNNAEKNISVNERTDYKLLVYIPSKRYSVKVSLSLQFCGVSQFWSDWSNEVFIEAEHSGSFSSSPMLILLVVVLNLSVLVIICLLKRVIKKMLVPVPDPQRKFPELFGKYNGDFQWLGYKEQIWIAAECTTAPIEEN
ncbi:interleukin-5 receptor subunit alpha-like isoform X2 [Callorhinchus milii]|uniref:interleukin-5 receptor subunit alpha-like isoform X2 n=1 Tax=Callorhinchus milii TaxID=7868 RepID=UPI001C3FC94D|nr:interleukin-5 receptor subunit alpha-like isoform X2 [Callorhinchus milii]